MLNLRLTQNRMHVKCGQKAVLFAMLDIEPDQTTQIARRGHHVVLVIDRSGSMTGKRIRDVKEAATNLVSGLAPDDLVSIVTFGSEVTVELSAKYPSNSDIDRAIRSIRTGGGTALHEGMQAAAHLLKSTTPGMVKRMEVFSDGWPNVGPKSDRDFKDLTRSIQNDGVTVDVFGIGSDYNGSLLMFIAELGRGTWEHITDTSQLTNVVNTQVTAMQNTVITSPMLHITLMDGAELATIAMTKPTLQEIDQDQQEVLGNTTSIKIKDIIKDESQTVAMRIAAPTISHPEVAFMTATITDGATQIANETAIISCTNDKELYNMEVDPSPRVILASSEATILYRRGLEGDEEATRIANTIISSLDDPETTRIMSADAQATVINAKQIGGGMGQSMSEEEKKRLLHDTTTIGRRPHQST